MDTDDREDFEVCILCGAQVSAGSERVFGFGTENVLCGQCAIARGRRYNALRDAWEVAPDLAGLPDEAYGASPHEVRRRRD
jgi:hypothetical protein